MPAMRWIWVLGIGAALTATVGVVALIPPSAPVHPAPNADAEPPSAASDQPAQHPPELPPSQLSDEPPDAERYSLDQKIDLPPEVEPERPARRRPAPGDDAAEGTLF